MKTLRLLLPFVLAPVIQAAAPTSYQESIDAVFSELRQISSMQSGTRYTLPAGGRNLTGRGDDFLRRRTANEIGASGLSCGCGDYAVLFIDRIKERGFEPLLIDSAQISFQSLVTNYSGHAVVAIRPKGDASAPWWLVDSTARNIISREWATDAQTFTASGHVYWIGYCGPLEKYPVHTPEELRQFYTRTLATVPRDFFNRTMSRMVFTIDPSMLDQRGHTRNPNLERLRIEQERILGRYQIAPERTVSILLTAGDNDTRGSLKKIGGQWVARVGLQSACSPSFLTYCEQVLRRDAAE